MEYCFHSSLPNGVYGGDEDALLSALAEQGMRVCVMNGSKVCDFDSFLTEAQAVLPMGPTDPECRTLGVLAEAVGVGLRALYPTRAAIMWRDADHLMECDLQGYVSAIAWLEDSLSAYPNSREWVNRAWAREPWLVSTLILLGHRPGFRRLDTYKEPG